MKEYKFKYGNTEIPLKVDETQILDVLTGNKTEPVTDVRETLYKSLDNPIDSESLSTVAKKAKNIVLVVSDITRFWMRQDLIIPHIITYLTEKCDKQYKDIKIVVANGTHRACSPDELKKIVTSEIYSKIEVLNHDCRASDLVYLGTTEYNTPVWINHEAAEADLVICLGAATYHVMAGFGGGRKSILPGISGLNTIKNNHSYSLDKKKFISNPKIGNGILKDNPLNEDMCQAASMMKNLFMITLVTDSDFRLTSIFSGHWKTSWEKACEEVKRIYTVPIKKKADVVITSCGGFPKDESLYQGTKAVDNVTSAVKDGGTIILFLEGRNGGGSPDYFDWIKPLKDGSFENRLRNYFTVGGYIFFLNCEQAEKFNILMYSSIPADIVAPMGIKAYNDLDKLMKDANLDGKDIYIIPNGSTVLPQISD